MVLVYVPEELGDVTQVVVGPLKQIRTNPEYKEAHNMVLPRVTTTPTESVGDIASAEVERESWAEGSHNHPLEHQDDLGSYHLGRGVFGINFVSPLLIVWIHVVGKEQQP